MLDFLSPDEPLEDWIERMKRETLCTYCDHTLAFHETEPPFPCKSINCQCVGFIYLPENDEQIFSTCMDRVRQDRMRLDDLERACRVQEECDADGHTGGCDGDTE